MIKSEIIQKSSTNEELVLFTTMSLEMQRIPGNDWSCVIQGSIGANAGVTSNQRLLTGEESYKCEQAIFNREEMCLFTMRRQDGPDIDDSL